MYVSFLALSARPPVMFSLFHCGMYRFLLFAFSPTCNVVVFFVFVILLSLNVAAFLLLFATQQGMAYRPSQPRHLPRQSAPALVIACRRLMFPLLRPSAYHPLSNSYVPSRTSFSCSAMVQGKCCPGRGSRGNGKPGNLLPALALRRCGKAGHAAALGEKGRITSSACFSL